MKAEFKLDLCFIRLNLNTEKFTDLLEKELESLFAGIGNWTIRARQEGQLDIALAEVNGIWSWETEAVVAAYLDQEASPQFWEWLQGYHVNLELKEEVTESFCQLKPKSAY
jgi:hypothetical protein